MWRQFAELLVPGRLASSFALLHTMHTLLALGFALVQLLVFARVLDVSRYAEMVFLTTLGLFLLPLSVAAGRANYSALRSGIVRGEGLANWPPALALLAGQFVLLNALSLLALVFLPGADAVVRLENVLFLNTCLIGNFWLNDVQPTVWAIELDPRFIHLLIGRMLCNYLALILLWQSRSLLWFVLATALANGVLLASMIVFFRRQATLPLALPRGTLTRGVLIEHGRRVGSTLLASLTEMVVLSLPYALLTVAYGIGPALIVFDVIMKMVRVVCAFARTMTEIALPRLSRALHTGERQAAWRTYLFVLIVSFGGALPLAALLSFWGPEVFAALLGPSDVSPPNSGGVAAVIVATSAFFQPALYMLSYNDARPLILRIAFIAVTGFAALAAFAMSGPPLLGTIWGYAAFFAVVTFFSLLLSRQAIRGS